MRKKLLLTSMMLMSLSSCLLVDNNSLKLDPGTVVSGAMVSASASNIQIVNDQFVITGTNLNHVVGLKLKESGTEIILSIDSKSSSQLIANSISNISLATGKVFDFIISTASASTTYTIDFSLCDSTLNGKGFDCTLTPNDKDVLSFDTTTNKWIPTASNTVGPWALATNGNISRVTGKVGIGTATPTGLLDVNGSRTGTGTVSGTTTIVGTGTAFLSQLDVGDIVGMSATGEERMVATITSDTSMTLHAPLVTDPAGTGFVIKKKVGLGSGNTSIGSSIGQPISSTAAMFADAIPKLEINTGGTTWKAFSELLVLRHGTGSINTAPLRQLGMIMKLSLEGSETDKMGGMTLESNLSYANFPTLYLVTANARRMAIDYYGKVGIGINAPTEKLDVVGNIKTSGCLYYASSSLGTCASDERIKKDVKPFDLGLEVVLGMRPVHFKYNGLGGVTADGKDQLGVIAQDLEKVAPELVKKQLVHFKKDDQKKTEIKAVDYGAFTYVLINSVKELNRELASLKKENAELKARMDRIEKANLPQN
jgi:hypothetical protein